MKQSTETSTSEFGGGCRFSMDEIACRETVPELWSDKRSPKEGFICHDYLTIYEREWGKWRDKPIRLMEIGLNKGASIKIWLEYFQQATIYGVDIADFGNEVGIPADHLERFVFSKGDQMDPYFWQRFAEGHPEPFDVIIDDGSHASGPIIVSFNSLWGKVKPGGYYVIEDLTEAQFNASHTPGFPTQIEFVETFIPSVIYGQNDIEEIFISKDLCILRKKK